MKRKENDATRWMVDIFHNHLLTPLIRWIMNDWWWNILTIECRYISFDFSFTCSIRLTSTPILHLFCCHVATHPKPLYQRCSMPSRFQRRSTAYSGNDETGWIRLSALFFLLFFHYSLPITRNAIMRKP